MSPSVVSPISVLPVRPTPSTSSRPIVSGINTMNGAIGVNGDSAAGGGHVLLLLDVQAGLLSSPPLGVPSSSALRHNISLILHHARAASPPPLIIHVRNCGDPGDPDDPVSPGFGLVFPPLPHEPVIDKRKNNAFAGTELGSLIRHDAELVVVGLQSDFCVRATCWAALGRGNEVLLIKEAHGTYNRIEAWYGGSVTPAHRIEAEVETELEDAGVVLLDMKDLKELFTGR
ncbi:Isochorismatase hydrolase [Pleurotus eryngii]|uniref:Isochorismatase hydrolase n=1 Tax=Pleurotus eryngii TaxID=5323 RepID=A0A9P6A6L5_PLEER|nr:Isochorismatase hydrolase [Pleurotus eryngii]